MTDLQKQLYNFAMSTTQDEYLEFVYKPLRQANGEKLRVDIAKAEAEHPKLIKAIRENWENVMSKVNAYQDESIERLQAENERLEEELKKNPIDFSMLKPPTSR